jgi:hypothetical protein
MTTSSQRKSQHLLKPGKKIKIRPHDDYRLAGCDYNMRLDATKTYTATPAENQPEWQEKGKVFVSFNDDDQEPSILLDHFDYKIIKP